MHPLVKILFWVTLKVLLAAFGLIYLGLVGMTYRTVGPSYPLRISLGDPARSAERFLVWLGVRTSAALVRAGRATLTALFEASAEVGDWYFRRRGLDARSGFHSRLL